MSPGEMPGGTGAIASGAATGGRNGPRRLRKSGKHEPDGLKLNCKHRLTLTSRKVPGVRGCQMPRMYIEVLNISQSGTKGF